VEEDQFGNVSFVGMQRVLVIFGDRPLFSELMGSARDELKCNSNEDAILVEGVLHHDRSGTIFKRLVPIASEAQWDKYVKTVMKNEFQCLDFVVRKLSNDPTPHGYSPLMAIRHPLCYPTARWMWKMCLLCPMLNPPRMRLEYVSMMLLLALRRSL
jgi:hypothetical protein